MLQLSGRDLFATKTSVQKQAAASHVRLRLITAYYQAPDLANLMEQYCSSQDASSLLTKFE